MGYIVAVVENRWIREGEYNESRVMTPIQYCHTEEEANKICDLFNEFYNYDLQVISEDELNSDWY